MAAHTITIRYCTLCNWMLRAGWMAQELLSTFGTDLAGGVTLIPDTGGVFQIHCNGVPIWDRKTDGGFPDAKVLKQRVRDQIDPTRNLGHIDRHAASHPAGRSHPAGPLPPNGQPGAPAFADRAIEALTRDGHPAGSAHAGNSHINATHINATHINAPRNGTSRNGTSHINASCNGASPAGSSHASQAPVNWSDTSHAHTSHTDADHTYAGSPLNGSRNTPPSPPVTSARQDAGDVMRALQELLEKELRQRPSPDAPR